MNELDGKIYKQETEETKRCQDVLNNVITKNNFNSYLQNLKIHVVHSPAACLFMSLDQNLFVSVKLIRLAETDDELALILTHELCHCLLGHIPLKYINLYLNIKKYNRAHHVQMGGGILENMKTKYNKYSCFYPEKFHLDKFYERRTDMMSHELILKAGYDIFTAVEIYKKVEDYIGKPSPYAFKKSDKNLSYAHYEMNKKYLQNANLELFGYELKEEPVNATIKNFDL